MRTRDDDGSVDALPRRERGGMPASWRRGCEPARQASVDGFLAAVLPADGLRAGAGLTGFEAAGLVDAAFLVAAALFAAGFVGAAFVGVASSAGAAPAAASGSGAPASGFTASTVATVAELSARPSALA